MTTGSNVEIGLAGRPVVRSEGKSIVLGSWWTVMAKTYRQSSVFLLAADRALGKSLDLSRSQFTPCFSEDGHSACLW